MPKDDCFLVLTASIALTLWGAPAVAADGSGGESLVSSWLAMVGRAQDEQPHWITPLVTITPRLEQEFRFDIYSEELSAHADLVNYGAGKGVEFIPTESTELFIGIPPYESRVSDTGTTLAAGWGDWTPFLLKYRFTSANEEQGNYVVTGFLQLSAPVGSSAFSNHFYIVQPTLALGKGWGDFDLQATIGEQFPMGGISNAQRNFGQPVLVNVTAQYHVLDVFWPEFEVNSIWWPDGTKAGKTQIFLTPGIIFGRFQIQDRVRAIAGVGYQFAVSPNLPTYRSNLVVTLRTTF